MYSPAQIQKVGDDKLHTAPVGTGPYKFVHQKKGQEIRLEANEGYWGGRPRLKAIVSKPYPDAGARVLALESGDVDLIFNVAPQEVARLSKNLNLQVLSPPVAPVIWVYFNTQKEPFKDKHVRQALMYAIDREAIAKNIFAGLANVLTSPAPPGTHGHTDKFNPYRYEPEKAKELLRAAGYPNGFSFSLHYTPGRYLLSTEVVEAMQGLFSRIGVTMRVVSAEWGAFSQMLAQPVDKNPLQASYVGWRSIEGDVGSAIVDFHSKFWRPNGNNVAFYKNEEFDRLIDLEQSTLDVELRVETLHRLQQILMDDLPALFLLHEPQIWAARKSLKGVEINFLTALNPLHMAYFEE